MSIEELIDKESKKEAKSQAQKMIMKNDIRLIKPFLSQLRSLGVDPSLLIDPSDSKDAFIKKDIIYNLKMIIYYLYHLNNYDPDRISMSRPNLRGAIYDRLNMLPQLINHLNCKDLNLINSWNHFKPMVDNKLDTKESKNELKTYVQNFLDKILDQIHK